MSSPQKKPDGSIEIATLLRADVCEPVTDIENDFGKFVAPIVVSRSKFLGKTPILAATGIPHCRRLRAGI